ncbi:putative membrane protein [Yoonia sediminilitoris]|uniref:Putative membrane protein n=2 Tax=Yoonia sediminilitoris TaxID=1286148 RepID=A0A2T6K1E7_9RHOB|nr:putative membrane protein [Yoonia sediminilitoris]RCW89456.1 putative membrane protein [Yoonia sediminilitoris]
MKIGMNSVASILTLPLCLTATTVIAQVGGSPERGGFGYHEHDMMWNNSQWGGFGMVLGPIFMILIVVAIVAGIIYLLRLFGTAQNASSQVAHDRALVILKERYAKGEIDTEEFSERKKLLID